MPPPAWNYVFDASLGTDPSAQGWEEGNPSVSSISGSVLVVEPVAPTSWYTRRAVSGPGLFEGDPDAVAWSGRIVSAVDTSVFSDQIDFQLIRAGRTYTPFISLRNDGLWRVSPGNTYIVSFDATLTHDYEIRALPGTNQWQFYLDGSLEFTGASTSIAASDQAGLRCWDGTDTADPPPVFEFDWVAVDAPLTPPALPTGSFIVGHIGWPRPDPGVG